MSDMSQTRSQMQKSIWQRHHSQKDFFEKIGSIYSHLIFNFKCVNKDAFEVLYGKLVRPHLQYAVHLWSPYQTGLREKLERTQRRATKLVRNIKHKSYEERLSTLNFLSTLDGRDRGDMINNNNNNGNLI